MGKGLKTPEQLWQREEIEVREYYPDFDTISGWLGAAKESKASHLVIVYNKTTNIYEPRELHIPSGSAAEAYQKIGQEIRYRVVRDDKTAWVPRDKTTVEERMVCRNIKAFEPNEIYCLRENAEKPLSDQVMDWRAYYFE